MYEKDILITDADHRRLRSLVGRLRASGRARARHVGALATRIRRAVIVSPKEIPRNVVTMNSRVYLKDLDSRKRLECTLSDPLRHRRLRRPALRGRPGRDRLVGQARGADRPLGDGPAEAPIPDRADRLPAGSGGGLPPLERNATRGQRPRGH